MRNLADDFARLDAEQRAAVWSVRSTVVLAGPGSGKTATLVLAVARILDALVDPPQGVACITFNNDAVTEFRTRLARYGITAGRRLFLGTLHSFCLNEIVRPYSWLVGTRKRGAVGVASTKAADSLFEEVATALDPRVFLPGLQPAVTCIRRARCCGEDLSGFSEFEVAVDRAYEARLASEGLVDFEAMVLEAVDLVSTHDWIGRLLAARFPWLVIDEYQDLGGPLHKLVTTLLDQGIVRVFAVGDPDQSVYDFTGADPKYLRGLAARADCTTVRLKFNYRSGGDLILAGQAALAPDEPRGYLAGPNQDEPGEIIFRKAADRFEAHAGAVVEAIRQAIDAGTPPAEIAVLYRSSRELYPEIKRALDESSIAFTSERDGKYPRGPLVRWLQAAAEWATETHGGLIHSFSNLTPYYLRLLEEAGVIDRGVDDLASLTKLFVSLRGANLAERLSEWLTRLDAALGLEKLLEAANDRSGDDLDAWRELLKEAIGGSLVAHSVRDFASDGRIIGKVVVTTLHSSKGRQFDTVVLPGLVEGYLPTRQWNRSTRQYEEPSPGSLQAMRRLFYVGFTRARRQVYLLYSDGYTTARGYSNRWGPSRFVLEIAERLREAKRDPGAN